MAKKGKDNSSLNEKLQAALVPDWEQPCRIPKNWCFTYLTKGFALCLDQLRKPINATEREKRQGNVPYYGATGQVGWIDNFLTDEELVLLGEDGAPFLDIIKNKAYTIQGKGWVNNHAHILKSHFGSIGNNFLMHYLNSFNFTGFVNGTTRLKLTQESMNKIPVPLPPLAEQQRIVERIENLFSKLDDAREKIQSTLDRFETRKSAILYKAFSGELTKKWREENGVSVDSWQNYTLGALLYPMNTIIPSGTFFEYIDIDAINNKNQTVFKPKTLKSIDAPSRARRKLVKNCILFSMVRPYLKNIAFIDESLSHCIASTGFYVCICRQNLIPKLLYFHLCSDTAISFLMQFMKGDNSPAIRKENFECLPMTLPSLPEQTEIVRILDSIFEKEQKAKELVDIVEKIDLMKKAILARAFRGELGTNDPNDENAFELLKYILGSENEN